MLGRRGVGKGVEVRTLIRDPDVFKAVVQILEPLVVAGIKSVLSEHLELAFGNLLCLLQLHRIELNYVVVLLLAIDIHLSVN